VLGQPVGSKQFAKEFFELAISNVEHQQVSKLFDSLSDKATILRLFSTCAMHKTPHLLGSEVLYTMDTVAPSSWDDWNGTLAQRIHRMASSFLARLTYSASIPETSMIIAYMSIAQGGLSLMDPHTRAIPDFTITMASAIRAATAGFYMGRDKCPVTIPQSLAQNFFLSHNHSSPILCNFQQFLPDIAMAAAPPSAANPISHFLQFSSPKCKHPPLSRP
jgi:hypothetical protein